MNGFPENATADRFEGDEYRFLIVAIKFQTGFDEPLVQSMYVDKKLSGVQCVQTLSRLNRTKKGKTDTFVLDFVNDTEDIVKSFQPYFTSTKLVGETDPDKLYDMLDDIKGYQALFGFILAIDGKGNAGAAKELFRIARLLFQMGAVLLGKPFMVGCIRGAWRTILFQHFVKAGRF